MTIPSLLAFSGGPDFAASIVAQILYGERLHGEGTMARLRSAFLNPPVSRPNLSELPDQDTRPRLTSLVGARADFARCRPGSRLAEY